MTLEELDISATNIDHEELVKLRSMPKLRVLRYSTEFMENCEIGNLTMKVLPHVIINEQDINVAEPEGSMKPKDGLWEIKAKQTDLFKNILPFNVLQHFKDTTWE